MQSCKALAKATGYTMRRIGQMAAAGMIEGALKDDSGRWWFPVPAVWTRKPRRYARIGQDDSNQ